MNTELRHQEAEVDKLLRRTSLSIGDLAFFWLDVMLDSEMFPQTHVFNAPSSRSSCDFEGKRTFRSWSVAGRHGQQIVGSCSTLYCAKFMGIIMTPGLV